jgi:Fe-S-cluster containining protein
MTLPCATCPTKCCHAYTVAITGYDMWTIARGLRLAPEEFVRCVRQEQADSQSQSFPLSQNFLLDRSGASYVLVLDKQQVNRKNKPCIFWLGVPGGTAGRCGIYSYRPLVCRSYPASLVGEEVVRLEDVLCPVDAWRDGTLQRPSWRDQLLRLYAELNIYWLAADRWNKHIMRVAQVENITAYSYLDYLMNFYSRLEPLREASGDGEWNAMCAWWHKQKLQSINPLADKIDESQPWAVTIGAIRNVAEGFFAGELKTA